MEQTILTPEQRIVLELFASEPDLQKEYYLTGGTALSEYYLQHRDSDDLDFFTNKKTDALLIETFIHKLTQQLQTPPARMERIHDRRLFFVPLRGGELKIEFTLYPFPALEKSSWKNGVLIDSLRDISANKLAALLDRFEPKDFVDLYFLLKNQSLEKVRSDVEKKFGLTVSSLLLGSELAKARRIEILPRMRKNITIEELKKFFTKLAQELRPNLFD